MHEDTIVITGGSGFIGRAIAEGLAKRSNVALLDLEEPDRAPPSAMFAQVDLTSEDSVRGALEKVRARFGQRISCVIHLAAYFDLTGEDDPKYDEITVRGTERLLRALRALEIELFAFASTMLVHAAGRPGERITEDRPLDPKLPYRKSKIETERLIDDQRDGLPVVHLRLAGVYDDLCRNAFLAHQIARIFECDPKARVYPGDPATGQSFLHIEDLVSAVIRLIERRATLPPSTPLLLGEPDVMGYGELQTEISRLLHGEELKTLQVPKTLAKTGSWVEHEVLNRDDFVQPWMADIASDHYELDVSRAQRLLGWSPDRRLRETLPKMIRALKANPDGWYEANHLDPSRISQEFRRDS